eukprot:9012261-Alexandrium_andersonii.AAC.1
MAMAATSNIEDMWSASTTRVGPPQVCHTMKRATPTGRGASEPGGPADQTPSATAAWGTAVE